MKLIVFHYHFRPGGIRRIIELATPHLVRESRGAITGVLLAGGEAPDADWQRGFHQRLAPVPVSLCIEPTFNYVSEQRLGSIALARRIRSRIDALFNRLPKNGGLVWAHNLGIARNLVLSRELVESCSRHDILLVAHHHDWWFDNRWLRWPEMRRSGFRTLRAAAETIFPHVERLRHVTINQSDARTLERHFPTRSGWLPNLAEGPAIIPSNRVRKAARWLGEAVGEDSAPIWIVPCRLLRRKNLAEAILLTRWLRPEGWLLTTGGVSSRDEVEYARVLRSAVRRHGWRVRIGVLEQGEHNTPQVTDLVQASEAVLLTSLQEGFGLPYLEAAAAEKPLIARSLLNIGPDLDQFGFRFPHLYEEILVDPQLFDREREHDRQRQLFRRWRRHLPESCRQWAGTPPLLADHSQDGPVAFSRLTLTAQLDVLAQPLDRSWTLCSMLNPFLSAWKSQAETGRLAATSWPKSADRWLSGKAYGRRFWEIVQARIDSPPLPSESLATQEDFMRQRLSAAYLYPLLWSRES